MDLPELCVDLKYLEIINELLEQMPWAEKCKAAGHPGQEFQCYLEEAKKIDLSRLEVTIKK